MVVEDMAVAPEAEAVEDTEAPEAEAEAEVTVDHEVVAEEDMVADEAVVDMEEADEVTEEAVKSFRPLLYPITKLTTETSPHPEVLSRPQLKLDLTQFPSPFSFAPLHQTSMSNSLMKAVEEERNAPSQRTNPTDCSTKCRNQSFKKSGK